MPLSVVRWIQNQRPGRARGTVAITIALLPCAMARGHACFAINPPRRIRTRTASGIEHVRTLASITYVITLASCCIQTTKRIDVMTCIYIVDPSYLDTRYVIDGRRRRGSSSGGATARPDRRGRFQPGALAAEVARWRPTRPRRRPLAGNRRRRHRDPRRGGRRLWRRCWGRDDYRRLHADSRAGHHADDPVAHEPRARGHLSVAYNSSFHLSSFALHIV